MTTSKNYKPFKTQLCQLLLTVHEKQILNTYTTKPRFFFLATQFRQLTETYPLHNLNAYSDLPINIKFQSFITMSTLTSSPQN